MGGGRIKRLFLEYPFLERFDRAAAAGFEAVEFPEPYGEDVRAIRAALTRDGLRQVQFNLPWGDHAAGEVGIATNPERLVEFRDGRVPRARGCRSTGLPAAALPRWDHAAGRAAGGPTGERG